MTALQWFYSFLRKYRFKLAFALFLVTVTSAIAIVNPYISGIIVDDVIEGGNRDILPRVILIMLSATIIRSVVRYSYLVIFENSSQGMLFSLRENVYSNFMKQDLYFYNNNRTGDLMSRQTGDMEAIRHFVAYVIYGVYENVLLFVIALVMIFTVDYRLALCMIAVMPITAWAATKQLKAVKPAFQNIRQHFSSLNAFVQENVSGNRVIRAFAKEDYEIEKFNKENDGYRNAEIATADIYKKYVPIFEFMANSLTVILYLVGGLMVIKGVMSIGKMVQISGYLWMLNMPLRQAGWLANDYQRFVTSIEKIYSTIQSVPSIRDPERPVEKKRFSKEIVFSNVSYKSQDEMVLRDINFRVKHGQTVGIIGATGSGKSTLMNLLCRFYDVTDGEITIDGVNVKDMDLYSLRDNIGMAMQDVFLFSDTIEGNIAYGRPDCSFDEVVAAAKIANAHDFIMEMPEGYDTIIGERGVGLSGGQKQRISLARALLKDPSIIILDDTTSAVDMETETQIQNALNEVKQRHTLFIIAHRISSIKDADLILVLEDGRITETGTHEELLAKRGYYYKVFNHQYGDFDKIRAIKSTIYENRKVDKEGGRKIG
ncbi:MAG: ABC transporter ATP-binding protein [Clostridiales bacterium]|nr:ABC transporter ATP-binding protein [Clostridiales bacterium]